jgi:hypothetical protein
LAQPYNGLDSVIAMKEAIGKDFFLEFILLGALAICKTRNAYIFESEQRIFYHCRAIFKKDVYAEK